MTFDDTYERHHASLFRYLHRHTGDADLADDLAQEAFIRLFRSKVPESEARPWLVRVATNLARDHGRSASRRARLAAARAEAGVSLATPPADAETSRARAIARVRAALDALDERERRMLLMREEGFRYREIADVVGVAPGSVGTLLARALARFRSAYADL